ncbi:MAG TPA: roadblock/LC7 domain-containing protein [Gemmatimonadales bacterium]|nr:roadblock/LC7 domain-containing protein [Gemmatimonadales bacterium]
MIPPLTDALETLAGRSDVAGALVVSDEGLVVAAAMPDGAELEAIAALAATAQRALASLSSAIGHGPASQTVLDGPDGSAVIVRLDSGATIVVLAAADGDLGDLLYAIRGSLPRLAGLV